MSILVSLRAPSQPCRFAGVGAVCLLFWGCGPSEPPPLGTLDPSSTTHPGVVTTISTGGEMLGCLAEPPPNADISDFSNWDGTNWGDSRSLNGESFSYDEGEGTVFEYAVDDTQGNMHITATVISYAGFGMAFNTCVDATAFTGIQFDLWGSASGAVFQVQTSEDQSKEYNDPKATCDTAVSGTCAVPQSRISDVPAAQTTVQLPWGEFSGGSPVPTVSTNQLIGLQWQFECSSGDPCPVDVRIDNVTFY